MDIKTNLTAVGELGQQWNSQPLINYKKDLSKKTPNANAGSLEGNRMFYTNDYMVGASEIRVIVMDSNNPCYSLGASRTELHLDTQDVVFANQE
jgi:hypothetical protein